MKKCYAAIEFKAGSSPGTIKQGPDGHADGKLSISGLAAARRDGCPATKKVSRAVLEDLMYSRSPIAARATAIEAVRKVRDGEYDLFDFVYTARFGKPAFGSGKVGAYKTKNAVSVIHDRCKKRGSRVPVVGERVKYVVRGGDASNPKEKRIAPLAEDPVYLFEKGVDIDIRHYVRVVEDAAAQILRFVVLPNFLPPETSGAGTSTQNRKWIDAARKVIFANSTATRISPAPFVKPRVGIARFFKVTHACPVCKARVDAPGLCAWCRSSPGVVEARMGDLRASIDDAEVSVASHRSQCVACVKHNGAVDIEDAIEKCSVGADCDNFFRRKTSVLRLGLLRRKISLVQEGESPPKRPNVSNEIHGQ